VLVKGVVRGGSNRAYRCVVITTFNTKAIGTYLSTLAFIGVVNGF